MTDQIRLRAVNILISSKRFVPVAAHTGLEQWWWGVVRGFWEGSAALKGMKTANSSVETRRLCSR